MPNLATLSAERAAEEQARADALQRAAEERAARYRARQARRRQMLAGEGYVVRDLGESLDRMDHPDPLDGPMPAPCEEAARRVLDAARAAPELFQPVLVDSLVELATDTADPAALEALHALVRAGRCRPRLALDAAIGALFLQRSVQAGLLFALLEPALTVADIRRVVDRLIELTAGEDWPWELPVSSDGLRAAARVDLATVTDRVIEHLASDDERTRQAGACAAEDLLAVDPTRITVLGPPPAGSIRGEDAGYAGTPHPTSAALRALAQAWRGEPALTRQIVETAAAGASQHVRDQLARVPWFIQRFRQPWDASPEATSQAIAFLARRASGDWGDEAAALSAEHLGFLADEISEAVAAHVEELLGVVLALAQRREDSTQLDTDAGLPPALRELERMNRRVQHNKRVRDLAEAIGRCARTSADTVLTPVRALFAATTGDDDHDRAARLALLQILEAAVSAETLRDVLPMAYTALCHADPVVRRGGIGLWAACAHVADTLPAELTELSVALIEDTYVIVHSAMLDKIPERKLPDGLAPRLLPKVAGWIATYSQPQQMEQHPDVLALALSSMYLLARRLPDGQQTTQWLAFALAYVPRCHPHDRERLLSAWWPTELKNHPAWVQAALATAASPDLIDYYNTRPSPCFKRCSTSHTS